MMIDSVESKELFLKSIIEALIKVAVIGVMAVWTFQLIKSFLIPVVWGVVLAVAAEPLIAWAAKKQVAGGRWRPCFLSSSSSLCSLFQPSCWFSLRLKLFRL